MKIKIETKKSFNKMKSMSESVIREYERNLLKQVSSANGEIGATEQTIGLTNN